MRKGEFWNQTELKHADEKFATVHYVGETTLYTTFGNTAQDRIDIWATWW